MRWLVYVLTFIVAFELTCRLEDYVRYRTPFNSPFLSHADLIVIDSSGARGRPNARFQKWRLNALGIRGPETSRERPAGTLRIIVAGASETFGVYESPGLEFPRQLEDSLSSRWLGGQCAQLTGLPRVEVLNLSLPGFSLPALDQYLATHIAAFAPQVVVLYPTPVQYLDNDPPAFRVRPGRPPDPTSDGMRALYPRALARLRNQAKALLPEVVLDWLRRRDIERMLRQRGPDWRFKAIPEDRLDLYEAHLRHAMGTIRSTGATTVVATHANAFADPERRSAALTTAWERFYARAPGPIIVAFDSAARGRTLRVAADSGAVVADLGGQITRAEDFADFSHFTDVGAARVASELTRVIADQLEAQRCGALLARRPLSQGGEQQGSTRRPWAREALARRDSAP